MSTLANESILETFYEEVFAVNRKDAVDTAIARNPKARVIGTNPDLK